MIHVTILSKNRCKKNLKDFRTYHLYRTAAAQSSCTKWAARYIVLARVRRSMTSLLAHWHLRAVASCRCETISETIFLIKKMNDATVSITLAGCFKLCFPQKFLRNWREYSEELWWKGTSIDYNWRQKKSETIVTLKKDPRFPESLPYWSFFFFEKWTETLTSCAGWLSLMLVAKPLCTKCTGCGRTFSTTSGSSRCSQQPRSPASIRTETRTTFTLCIWLIS